MLIAGLALFFLASGPGGVGADVYEEAQMLCEARWPVDFEMQKHCFDKQMDAFRVVIPVAPKDASDPLYETMAMCFSRWRDKTGIYDWEMIAHCWGKQSAAYKALKGK